MKLLFDLFPVILFFITFKVADIYAATAVAIAATAMQIAYLYWKQRRVDTMQWVSLGLILVFGGATLIAHNETFIKWKPSVLYWFMGLALWVSQAFFKKNLLQTLMGSQVQLPAMVWKKLNLAWISFFSFMGLLNIYVAYSFSTDAWVNFKLFGGLGLMLLFVILQSLFLAKYVKDDQA